MNPAVMLCDEVTSALDPELVGEVLGVIEQLAREGMTMVIVTHEVAFAHEVADLVAFMSDGVIVESGPPAQLLENPQNPRTRGFLARFHRLMGSFPAGANSVFDGKIVGKSFSGPSRADPIASKPLLNKEQPWQIP